MKLLLVEDDDNKRKQLGQVVSEMWPDAIVTISRSLQSGLRAIRGADFDLVLLDMSLPTYDVGPDEPGGSTHAFGGREFLKELRRFKKPLPVIVVTQFEAFGSGPEMMTLEALEEELRAAFPVNYRGYVYYNATTESWKEQLRTMVDSAILGAQ